MVAAGERPEVAEDLTASLRDVLDRLREWAMLDQQLRQLVDYRRHKPEHPAMPQALAAVQRLLEVGVEPPLPQPKPDLAVVEDQAA